jgi:hypothetical protein
MHCLFHLKYEAARCAKTNRLADASPGDKRQAAIFRVTFALKKSDHFDISQQSAV